AAEVRNPETVNHVVRSYFEANWASGGDMNFVGRCNSLTWDIVRIRDLPPPLMTGDFDIHRVVRGHGSERTAGHRARHNEAEQNQRRDDAACGNHARHAPLIGAPPPLP